MEPQMKSLYVRGIKRFQQSKYLLLMFLPGLLFYIIFRYLPMYGITIAFKQFNIVQGVMESPWVGLKYFKQFINDPFAFRLIRNTFLIGLYNLVFAFPIPILLAILLNEVQHSWYKRGVQTIAYLPHFISEVVVVGMMMNLLSPESGIVNSIIRSFGGEGIYFMAEPSWFRTLYIGSGIWKETGWGAIIYIAALAGIDAGLYEAAYVEGANRLQRIWHIALPGIMPTVSTMLLLRLGNMFSVGFEKIILMYSSATYETADVLSTYVYRQGLAQMNYSYATAVDLMNNLVNLLLIILANRLSKKVTGYSLW